MRHVVALISALVFLSQAQKKGPPTGPPTLPDVYHAKGFILMPYCELREPFTIYFNGKSNKSRIDYYDGEMKTFQNESGTYQVVWTPNKETHAPEEHCYISDATPIQGVFPNTSKFKFVRTEKCDADTTALLQPYIRGKKLCNRFEEVIEEFNRTTTFIIWTKRRNRRGVEIPVRYMMLGYDNLFGGHYDKYELVYTLVMPGPFDERVFNIQRLIKQECSDFPSPTEDHFWHLTPIAEFTRRNDSHMDDPFEQFREKHRKNFSSQAETQKRRANFVQNTRFVNSMNRRKLTYALKLNHRADWGPDDFRMLRGRLNHPTASSRAEVFPKATYENRSLPDHVDWRSAGAVTPIKDQALCGSCWSFATVGTIEAQYFRKYGKLVQFSEQQLIDCSWNEGNDGCDGGREHQAYHYVKKYGLASARDYGPYRSIDGKCRDKNVAKTLKTLKTYHNVTSADELRQALAFIGPVAVGVDSSQRSFSFYSHGVYDEPKCNSSDLNHAVLIIGYGDLEGNPYWLVKNSWSTHWGNQGIIMISQKGNMCGVTESGVIVEL